ncbi:MAG TPA: DUF58 domain-containing protein [Candidatus Omnitrophica bacterium]|nr:MAG: DUF58 domain-containing protein [Candidatus Omnitrophota bacterium]RKY44505.1 MAG: DUF58 domain-containing protein [Candidatus Omnitrophota bacterium]HEC69647.1 DUF58 domain-containing protein [Candidatus Omnitrophota bacterium]
MIPKEVLTQIRYIQIITSRLVNEVFAGEYQSVFKGRGMEFEEVREYQPGDDIRSIDWNVTARMNSPYVKKFIEERELTVMILLDVSASFYFSSVNKLKRRISAEVASILAFSAMRNKDKVGLVLFTDQIEKFLPPKKGLNYGLRIIREALYFQPFSQRTDVSKALDFLNKVCKRKAVVFIISDFYSEGFEHTLSLTNKHHDLIAITITDPKELELPNLGIVSFFDPEAGEEITVDTSSPKVREAFKKRALSFFEKRDKIFERLGIDNISLRTDISYKDSLVTFFSKRKLRR